MNQAASPARGDELREALVAAINDFAARLNRGVSVQGDVVLRQLLEEVTLAAKSPAISSNDHDESADDELLTLISRRGPEVGPIYEYASVILAGALCHEIERQTGTSPAALLASLHGR